MKKIILLLLFAVKSFAQDVVVADSLKQKTNPIAFIESYFGIGAGAKGTIISAAGSLNYQFNKRDLITARFIANYGYKSSYLATSPFIFFPVFYRTEKQNELAFLYGKRYVFSNYSVSLSSGVSYVNRNYFNLIENENGKTLEEKNDQFFGIPFELNIKWFKGKKSRFRAYYGIIPIGKKKISFGRSVGFKLAGNIAKGGYMSLGLSYGFGWHKKY